MILFYETLYSYNNLFSANESVSKGDKHTLIC